MNFMENESAQKLRGGYYTHPDIASFLSRWVLQIDPRKILEPSCGDGAFLRAIASLRPRGLAHIQACEIDPIEAKKASAVARSLRSANVSIHEGDFLQWSIDQLHCPQSVDGVLGNPPFIRYQYLDTKQQSRAKKIFDAHKLPFTKHTNAWVPFVISSISQLRPGGRLGMVIPSEVLHVLHAQAVRRYLISSCDRIVIIDPELLLFDGTCQGVVLLMAEKKAPDSNVPCAVAISKFKGRASLTEDPCKVFSEASFIDGASLDGKWTHALLTSSERTLLDNIASKNSSRRFKTLADVNVGIITGANKFFLVPDSVVDMYSLREFAHPMFGRSDHVRGVIYDNTRHEENRKSGLPANFLWFGSIDKAKLTKSVRGYIETGEAAGLHKRYKCRIRTPWYDVPYVHVAPIGMLKRSHNFPRMILNKAGAFTTDTAYRIVPKGGINAERLVACFVNSLTMLSAELEGRSYGGGVLELVPSEIERLLIPWSDTKGYDLNALDRAICADQDPVCVLDAQDRKILYEVGIKKSEAEELRSAWLRLKDRRQRIVSDDDELENELDHAPMPLRKVRGHSMTSTNEPGVAVA